MIYEYKHILQHYYGINVYKYVNKIVAVTTRKETLARTLMINHL